MWPLRKKQGEELNHWIASAESFTYSPKAFYEELEQKLSERKVPDLTMEQIEFGEGGPLSDQRTYLRIQREHLLFDICAAPFGTAYFFSCRTVRLPVIVRGWHLLFVGLVLVMIFYSMAHLFGIIAGGIMTLLFLLACSLTLRNAATLQTMSMDGLLTRLPVIGTLYEAWFKKDTYHRIDTRLMYLDLIPNLVRELSEAVTSAKGVRLVRQYQVAPILGELYKPVAPREPDK
jgi:hypothetical protein